MLVLDHSHWEVGRAGGIGEASFPRLVIVKDESEGTAVLVVLWVVCHVEEGQA